MKRILYIQASPRGARSASERVAQSYIDALRAKGAIDLDVLDVWTEDLPAFDGAALEAKYAGLAGTPLNAAQKAAWAAIDALGARFRAADEIVMSVPMWNFGVPYRLKHLIDLVTQKDVTFTFDANGFGGMLKRQRAVIVCARGLEYVDGTPISEENLDYQKAYLISWLSFLGVGEIKAITVEKGLLGAEASETAIAGAAALARDLAA
ncbi:MAG: NAD(P)H-dependent oxidoreductase [Proteobacteria bacterium]|nr:NAD(P)H-dependent oxidoreductase [Pseudomonadota bacterium]